MGLGKLNPGCNSTCDGCTGCFGSITTLFCKIQWVTSGDPFYVEVRLNGIIVSNAKSGSFNDPPSGEYSLYMQCEENDDLIYISKTYVAESGIEVENCETCCEFIGPLGDSSVRIPVAIEMQGHPVWQAFNGTYYLHRRECEFFFSPCMFEYHTCFSFGGGGSVTPKVTWPLGPPGVFVNETCKKILTANLYTSGFYLGQWMDSSTIIWDTYVLPYQLSPRVTVNNSLTGGTGFPISVTAIASVTVYDVRVSPLGVGSNNLCWRRQGHFAGDEKVHAVLNDFFGNQISPGAINVLPCGSGTKTGINSPGTDEAIIYSRFPALAPLNMTVTLFPT